MRLWAVLVVAGVAILAPAVAAQGEATSSVEITGLPAAATADRAVALLPFNVTYTLDGLVCVGGALTVTIDLSARTRGGNATARTSPPQMFFTIEHLDNAQGGYAETQEGLLVVERADTAGEAAGTAAVAVRAEVTYFSGCGVLNVPGDDASADTSVSFAAQEDGPEAAVPSPAWLAALALALALGALRRAGARP